VLLYELNPADEPTFVFTNSWADPLVLSQSFAFPAGWSTPPRLFSLTQWQDRVQPDGSGGLQWWVPAATWDEHWEPLQQGNVILLSRAADGSLTRLGGPIAMPGATLELKPSAAPRQWAPAQLNSALLK
jgi:hypothetical protein